MHIIRGAADRYTLIRSALQTQDQASRYPVQHLRTDGRTDGRTRTSYYVFISYILCKHYWDFKIRYAEVSKASRPNDIFMQRLVRKTMQGIDRSKRGCEDNIKMVLKSRRR